MRNTRYAAITLALAVLLCAGCSQQELSERVEQAKTARQTAAEVRQATTQALAAAEAAAADLPENDPAKAEALALAKKIRSQVEKADRLLSAADGALKTAQTGEIDPALSEALRGVPYGSWALLAITAALAGYKHFAATKAAQKAEQAQGDLKAVVKSIDAAIPEKTEHLKTIMRSVQGAEVSARVESLRT